MASKRNTFTIASPTGPIAALMENGTIISLEEITSRTMADKLFSMICENLPNHDIELWEHTAIYNNDGVMNEYNNRLIRRRPVNKNKTSRTR